VRDFGYRSLIELIGAHTAPSEKDSGGARTVSWGAVIGPWYQDGWVPGLTILVLNINVITEVELEFCLVIYS
jgi:hypothetical protein